MVTNLGQDVFIDFEPDEFTLTSWAKYRRIPAPIRGMEAQTAASGSSPTFDVGIDGSDIVVTRVQGRVALTRNSCWVVSGRETSDLLEHEQGHYYITYIPYVVALQAIRALRVPVAGAHIPRGANAHVQQTIMHNAITLRARTILGQVQTRGNQLTAQYDAPNPPGTNHSRNRPEQQIWNQRFSVSLTTGSAL